MNSIPGKILKDNQDMFRNMPHKLFNGSIINGTGSVINGTGSVINGTDSDINGTGSVFNGTGSAINRSVMI